MAGPLTLDAPQRCSSTPPTAPAARPCHGSLGRWAPGGPPLSLEPPGCPGFLPCGSVPISLACRAEAEGWDWAVVSRKSPPLFPLLYASIALVLWWGVCGGLIGMALGWGMRALGRRPLMGTRSGRFSVALPVASVPCRQIRWNQDPQILAGVVVLRAVPTFLP